MVWYLLFLVTHLIFEPSKKKTFTANVVTHLDKGLAVDGYRSHVRATSRIDEQ